MKKISYIFQLLCSRQFVLYLAGMIVMAFGITLNTKTSLGVSPIISIPYSLSTLLHINLGLMTFLFYSILVFFQFLLLGKKFAPIQWLQIPLSLITSFFINLFDLILPNAQNLMSKFVLLVFAVILTGIGASLTVGMKLLPNPADGLANVLGIKLKKGFGFGKNLFDFSCLFLSICIGLLSVKHLIGIGIGTVLSMLFTGRVVALCQKKVSALYVSVTTARHINNECQD